MRRAMTACLPALGLVVLAHREHSRARARQSSATADLLAAIETYEAADDVFQEADAKALDARALVGEWQASEYAAVNPDIGGGA